MPRCCGRWFNPNGYQNHLDNSAAHADNYECQWCYDQFRTTSDRAEHEEDVHWYHCDDCTFIFEDHGALNAHVEAEHRSPFCYGCNRSFKNLNNLNQHLKSSVHVGKNVKCPWCPEKFTNLTGVTLHLESGSCTSGINRQKINQYCREVDRDHVFTKLQIEWHGGSQSPTTIATDAAWDGNWYRCYFCDKGFAQLQSLNQHLSSPVHEQKIYHCPRCKREYIALSGLVNHLESESCGKFRFEGRVFQGLGTVVNRLQITQ